MDLMSDCDGCVMSVLTAALNLDAVIRDARCENQVLEFVCLRVIFSISNT